MGHGPLPKPLSTPWPLSWARLLRDDQSVKTMMPGGRMNPRMMRQLQRQMTKGMEEIQALEVIIRTADKEYVFNRPSVTSIDMAGQRTFQVMGEPEVRPLGSAIPEEDIQLVMDQTGTTAEQAKAALEACNGEPAEAILKLLG